MSNEIHEECGVAAIALLDGKKESLIPLLYKMLLKMQDRGQLAAGFATYNHDERKPLKRYRANGLVDQVFSNCKKLKKIFKGTKGIGHTRYAVSGSDDVECAQPFLHRDGDRRKRFALAFNGNIANYRELKKKMEEKNIHLETTVDTELLLYLMNEELTREIDMVKVFGNLSQQLDGAYNIAFLNANDDLAVIRDPLGIRPMCYGMKDGIVAAASESVALDALGIENIIDLPPGHMLLVTQNDVSVKPYTKEGGKKHCMFEWIYFANATSVIEGKSVYEVREELGRKLGVLERFWLQQHNISFDELMKDYVVIPVPNSARPASEGFAQVLGIPKREGLIPAKGRTFIDHSPDKLEKVADKFDVIRPVTQGKKLYVIEDSIVRGNTAKGIATLLRTRGKAKEIHMRITCPPIKSPCFYGIDMSTFNELVAVEATPEQIAEKLNLDSLVYQPLDGLIASIGIPPDNLCLACLTGEYPTPQGKDLVKEALTNYLAGVKKRTYE